MSVGGNFDPQVRGVSIEPPSTNRAAGRSSITQISTPKAAAVAPRSSSLTSQPGFFTKLFSYATRAAGAVKNFVQKMCVKESTVTQVSAKPSPEAKVRSKLRSEYSNVRQRANELSGENRLNFDQKLKECNTHSKAGDFEQANAALREAKKILVDSKYERLQQRADELSDKDRPAFIHLLNQCQESLEEGYIGDADNALWQAGQILKDAKSGATTSIQEQTPTDKLFDRHKDLQSQLGLKGLPLADFKIVQNKLDDAHRCINHGDPGNLVDARRLLDVAEKILKKYQQ